MCKLLHKVYTNSKLGCEPVIYIYFILFLNQEISKITQIWTRQKQNFPKFSIFLGLKTISCQSISTHINYLGFYHYLPHQNSIFFIGKFSPNLNNLNNMIVTYTKDFSSQKMDQIRQISKKRKIQIAKFLVGSQEYRKVLFFKLSYLIYNQIWLNYFWNDRQFHQFGCITKSLQETLHHKSVNIFSKMKKWTI